MRNLNTFLLKYLNKGSYLALSVQSQVKLVKLIYIVDIIVIETQTCKVICIIFEVLSNDSTTYFYYI